MRRLDSSRSGLVVPERDADFMHQVLFRIPIRIPGWLPDGVPIYGYGMMLFLAFILGVWIAGAALRKWESAPTNSRSGNLAIRLRHRWCRLTYMYVFGVPFIQFVRLWDGGLIFYGSVIGGLVGFVFVYFFVIRKASPQWLDDRGCHCTQHRLGNVLGANWLLAQRLLLRKRGLSRLHFSISFSVVRPAAIRLGEQRFSDGRWLQPLG